jgi:hypothetical protein
LIHNEEYFRKVLPFLKSEYFSDRTEKIIFDEIEKFTHQYNSPPTANAIDLAVREGKNLTENDVRSCEDYLGSISESKEEKPKLQWLIDKTEKFCQEKAVYNAVLGSISILDGKDRTLEKGSIPKLLSDALSVSFDNSIGHDYLEDADSRYEFYHRKKERIPFDLDYFNKITKGGLPKKTLNIALAGCVHPETIVLVRYRKRSAISWITKEITISEIKTLLNDGYDIEINSPDGFVPVSLFVDKGIWEEYKLKLIDGREVRVNGNHLFETNKGWEYAKDIYSNREELRRFLCDNGWFEGIVTKTSNKIPIVDIQVEHDNHRYYANGVSSHNTGVGKSLFMCHVAAAAMSQGYNALYITLEMAEEKIAERIDANLLNVTVDELSTLSKELYDRKVKRVKEMTTGKLIIKEYPTASASSVHFRTLLNELELKRNFIPDIIFIDYLNICCSSRIKAGASVNSYTYVKAIAEELRGLAVEFNVPIVSATQTTRGGFTSSDPGLEDTSESFGLPATADLMFAIISSEELESLNQLMIKQLKNRYNDPTMHKRFVVGVDRAKMKLYDVEQSAQQGLADAGNTQTMQQSFSKSNKRAFETFKV